VKALAGQLLALGCLLGLTGCGLGAGPAPKAISVLVSRDFGARVLRETPRPHTAGQETVMSLMLRNFSVKTRYGGGFIQSIEGLAGGEEAGRRVDWFYYVNGVEASKGAAATQVHPGDHIWWDHHDWSQTDDVPAVVGAYPQPFLNGIGGRRLPVRVECAAGAGSACATVTHSLRSAGVPAAIGGFGAGGGSDLLRVLVGPWARLRADRTVAAIERGPRASGVYATFTPDGGKLRLLTADGRGAEVAGAGLIAATGQVEESPVWVVTGGDEAAVERAAAAFDEADLHDRFALAVGPNGATAPLPIPAAEISSIARPGGSL
jgi:Domain of unknown function (DUF4430)